MNKTNLCPICGLPRDTDGLCSDCVEKAPPIPSASGQPAQGATPGHEVIPALPTTDREKVKYLLARNIELERELAEKDAEIAALTAENARLLQSEERAMEFCIGLSLNDPEQYPLRLKEAVDKINALRADLEQMKRDRNRLYTERDAATARAERLAAAVKLEIADLDDDLIAHDVCMRVMPDHIRGRIKRLAAALEETK